MPEAEKIVHLFETLFTLIRDVLSSVNKLTSEVGKHRASTNEVIQIFRDRPCFEEQAKSGIDEVKDHAIKKIGETGKSADEAHIKSLSDANDKLVKLIIIIFTIMAVASSAFSGAVLWFIDRNPQVWEVIKILVQNGGK